MPTMMPPAILKMANSIGKRATARIKVVMLSMGEEIVKANTGPREAPFLYNGAPIEAAQQEQKGCGKAEATPAR